MLDGSSGGAMFDQYEDEERSRPSAPPLRATNDRWVRQLPAFRTRSLFGMFVVLVFAVVLFSTLGTSTPVVSSGSPMGQKASLAVVSVLLGLARWHFRTRA